MRTYKIIKGSSDQITKNFNAEELRIRSSDAPEVYFLDADLVNVLQFIRSTLGIPIIVTSAGRTKKHQADLKAQGLTSTLISQHVLDNDNIARAIDFKFASGNQRNILIMRGHVEQKTPFFQELRKLGLKGIGFYDSFIHIDTRKEEGFQKDEFGSYALFNNQKALKKKQSPLSIVKKLSETFA